MSKITMLGHRRLPWDQYIELSGVLGQQLTTTGDDGARIGVLNVNNRVILVVEGHDDLGSFVNEWDITKPAQDH